MAVIAVILILLGLAVTYLGRQSEARFLGLLALVLGLAAALVFIAIPHS